MFTRYAEQYGGDSAAAQAMMASELARRSLSPTRQFSDGTGLPVSFDDVRVGHRAKARDPSLQPDIGTAHEIDRQRTSRFGAGSSPRPVDATVAPVRSSVEASADDLRARVRSGEASFDARAEVVRTEDGTVATKKSLLKQSAKQVKEDAGATYEGAKDAVRDLLKKK